MQRNWSIRDYHDGDEHNINDLFNSIFNKNRTLDGWNWEFKRNPEGIKLLVAVDNHHIIGHLGSLHRGIKIEHKNTLASLEVDGMTHPDYGRSGIFISLGKRLLSDFEKEDIDIVLGFPNYKALPGHRKLNCIELFSLYVMIRPVNFQNIAKKMFSNRFLRLISEKMGKFTFRVIYRVRKEKLGEDVIFKSVSRFDDRFDRFWEEACSSHPIILTRNSRYLNWRYIECPEKRYQIFIAENKKRVLAMVIVRVFERFGLRNGVIVDILAIQNHENVVQSLVQKAMKHLEDKEVDLIACSIPQWSAYRRILRKCGFVNCPKRLNPKEEPFIIYPISKDIDMDMIKNPRNWFITWGDTDVV